MSFKNARKIETENADVCCIYLMVMNRYNFQFSMNQNDFNRSSLDKVGKRISLFIVAGIN